MFDSHAHVAFEQFDDDRSAVRSRAHESGLSGWLEVGSSVARSRRAVELAEQTAGVWAAVGVHPDEVSSLRPKDWQTLDELAGREKVVAIGEVGLDFYRGGSYEKQIEAVAKFVDLAVKHNKPIVWHVRSSEEVDANERLLDYLENWPASNRPKGVAHSFSGTVEQAKRYTEMGFALGISGVVTFKNAGVLLEVVRAMPLESLLAETDSPFLAPDPYRGQRNEPAYVKLVVQKIAELKQINEGEAGDIMERNFHGMINSGQQ